ncbi:syndetin isoform X2 [Agrilus planipennis]|uniref:Syndetin isoform X2 n=1 Tax=Agrilus planipennis TaxID=224129 RepID=A0A7F5R054_AGRPL|nr:syndetin isoform X2 [Agrilus planipennis]
MDEFKQKILSLINKQGPKIPSMGFDDIYQFPPVQELSINSKTVLESDRPADQDILESIEDSYFSVDENYDICRYVLSKLPEILDCEEIQRDFKNLKQQHQVVSKKVLQLILEHQTACNEEFERILEIIDKVKDALVLCTQSRNELNVAEKQLSFSLSILENYRKRKIVQNLLHNLKTIKTLYQTDHRLQELLDEENYAGAIELLQECQAAANTYRHFTCVAALTNKLQETLEETEEKLDQVLAQMCYYFDSIRYSKLQDAFKLLGKTQIAMDHLHMHYTSAIYNTALNIVRVYVDCAEFLDHSDHSGKKPFDKLCLSINHETFIPCLVDLCKSLFKIVLSYHQLTMWHNNKESEPVSPIGTNSIDFEENFNRQYIKQKLESGLLKIWHDVQSKISVVLLNSNLASYKFDQFVQVLSVVHRLIEVGEEFCGNKSEELQESIRKQSANYFRNYHSHRLEELKIFLENESWEICPVKPTFEILQLQEFKSLRSVLKNFKARPQIVQSVPYSNSPDCNSSNHSQDGSSIVGNFFLRYAQHGTPFDLSLDETITEEDILASVGDEASGYFSEESEEEESEELRKDFVEDFVDETAPKIPQKDKREKHSVKAPILTNTTLTVLRQMGKYLQMSRLLRPIAFDIIMCMTQLFDFYLYTVHSFFASDLTVSGTSLYSIKFSATLKRISDDLVTDETNHQNGKVLKPILSSIVNLSNPEDLNGLAERICAVESVVFLAKQYEFLQNYMEYLIPTSKKASLQHFFSQVPFKLYFTPLLFSLLLAVN